VLVHVKVAQIAIGMMIYVIVFQLLTVIHIPHQHHVKEIVIVLGMILVMTTVKISKLH
jgi:hypothetical protein